MRARFIALEGLFSPHSPEAQLHMADAAHEIQMQTVTAIAPERASLRARGATASNSVVALASRALFALFAAARDHADLTVDFGASTGRESLRELLRYHT